MSIKERDKVFIQLNLNFTDNDFQPNLDARRITFVTDYFILIVFIPIQEIVKDDINDSLTI
ncbi:MAG TPA: hypothetical protein VK169_05280 [Saprospiraceae bacterium]|nr:hypothetical protein [Saprospiraceae bacterium]